MVRKYSSTLLFICISVFSVFFFSCKDPLTSVSSGDSASGSYNTMPSFFTFRAQRVDTLEWYDVPARRLYVGEYSVIYVEEANLDRVSDADALSISLEFDSAVYPLIRTKFGAESDVDGNGKITILILDILDGPSESSYVAGYFHPVNEFSSDSYPNSNETDMLYMDLNPGIPGSSDFNLTMAHEFQHLVNFYQKVFVQGSSTGQDTWINEGLSSAAEYLYKGAHVGSRILLYNSSGYSARSEIQNGKNFLSWDGSLANYSTVYLFFQWLRIHADNGDALYKEILDSSYDDFRAVEASASSHIFPESWQAFLRSWFAANALNAETGVYGYSGEITLNPPVYTYSGTSPVSLKPGEGLYTAISESAYMNSSGNIDYAGLDTSEDNIDDTGIQYDGDLLLSYNFNGDPRGPAESTDSLPAALVLPTPALSSRTLVPEKIRVGVIFTPEGTIQDRVQ